MKKNSILVISIIFMLTSNAQTIVWKQLASLPKGYRNGEAVVLGNQIYFVAGCTDNSCPPYFYKYDPTTNVWTKMANVPGSTLNIALATVNGKIYAIGGDPFRKTNYEFTPETNTWKELSPMPTGRQHIDCGIYENKIYIIGGLTDWKTISQKNEMYDISANSWTEKREIPSLRNNPAIVNVDSLIYVIGGGGNDTNIWTNIATVECYNVKTDKWEKKKDLPYPVFKPAAIVINNNILVLGGIATINGKDSSINKVLLYKAETDEWQEITTLPEENIFFGCTNISNKIYVIGGMKGVPPNYSIYSTVYEGEYISANIPEYQYKNIKILLKPTEHNILIKNIDVSANDMSYKLINAIGQIVQDGKLISSSIYTSSLKSGSYILVIEKNNSQIFKEKIIVE